MFVPAPTPNTRRSPSRRANQHAVTAREPAAEIGVVAARREITPLTNTQLAYYDSNILRLPADKRKEYHAQGDRLVSELSKSVRNKTEIKITRVVKPGSFAKFTILRKTSVDPG